ncbi:lipid A deacylase LpxR family protein [Photobacterium minamisatsumaniensis]|uniref:lipid A deacylase LpxR family protein n=1 Tax=Photobacterium minamisatsumaniensis TaxID=2910233 RepID=UPI003D0F473E
MKQISTAFVVCMSLVSPVSLAYNAGSISFTMDNDGIVGTDQNYTNGIFLEFNSAATPMLDVLGPTPIKQIASVLPFSSSTQKGWNFRFGQQMWTPEDIEATEPLADERPYAGLLFFETGIYQYSPSIADKYSVMIGLVGPNAMAEKSQKFIHSIVGSDEPMGWDYQIDNQVVFNLGYEGHRLVTRQRAFLMDEYDVSGIGRINVGNYQSEVAVGGAFRWGNSLSGNFGTTGFTPGKFVDISVLSTSASGYFLFTGIEGRYRFNDITIDGDRPDGVPDTTVENWQATAVLGGVYYQPKWGISLSFATSTPEFEEDPHGSNSVGSLELFWRL